MLSIICAYNDKILLKKLLLQSLRKQKDVEYETIFLNAKELGFRSAAETLNFGCSKAKGDFFVICHQDIVFESENVLKEIEDYCKKLQFGIVGVAGIASINKQSYVVLRIKEGPQKNIAGNYRNFNDPIKSYSLDECLFVIPSENFTKFNDLGMTWHLYASDYAYQCHKDNLEVYTLPIENIYHASNGKSFNFNYFEALEKLSQKCKKDFKYIYTIYGKWPTNPFLLKLKINYRKLRYKFFHK